jgi:hypothetical protein
MHKIRNFYEGHSSVGEWQGNGMLCVNRPKRTEIPSFTSAAVAAGVTDAR